MSKKNKKPRLSSPPLQSGDPFFRIDEIGTIREIKDHNLSLNHDEDLQWFLENTSDPNSPRLYINKNPNCISSFKKALKFRNKMKFLCAFFSPHPTGAFILNENRYELLHIFSVKGKELDCKKNDIIKKIFKQNKLYCKKGMILCITSNSDGHLFRLDNNRIYNVTHHFYGEDESAYEILENIFN